MEKTSELEAAHDALLEEHVNLLDAHAALKAENDALKAALPQPKPEYQYAEGECHPVPMAAGNVCPKCGWEFGKDTSPHAVQ